MTKPLRGLRAHRAAQTEHQLSRARAFIAVNRNELSRIMRVAAGEAGTADAELLSQLLSASRPAIGEVQATLGRMRDDLAEAEAGLGCEMLDSRPDLDAAVRWHGARLDDLIASLRVR